MNLQAQTKPIKDASVDELRDFAQISLGLEVTGTENRNVILNKMKAAGLDVDKEGFAIVLHKRVKPVEPGVIEGQREKRDDGRWYRAITVHAASGEGGDRPVPVRVNGRNILIPRDGKRHWVPEEYVEALDNARQTVWEFTGKGIMHPREVHSYPFSA